VEIGQKVVRIKVNERHYDIPQLISHRTDRDRSVYFVSGLASGGGRADANAYRALNMRREYFVDYAIRAILWLVGDEAIELSRHAPDFWAFRHRVVELNNLLDQERLDVSANELPERGRRFPGQPEDLEGQIQLHEAMIGELPKRAASYSTRLDLLSTLGVLYQTRQAYDQSIRRLKQGIVIAKQLNNTKVLAELWGKMGSVYVDMDQLPRAKRAYRKAIRLNAQDAETWIALGHIYQIEKRFSNAIIAYNQAILLDPQNSSANSSLVVCYRQLGKDDLTEERRK
jgi:tetratricopeptide (TPR) repeat protein